VKKWDGMLSIKHCESMCLAGRFATGYVHTICQRDPGLIPRGNAFSIQSVRDCHDDLEDTYFIRLFAVFEWILRDFWRRSVRRRSEPHVQDLINGVAARCYVRADSLERAHVVRERRNALVHGGEAAAVTLSEARSHLCIFLRDLPREW